MKKLVLFAAVALSMSMFSCGNGEKAEGADSAAVNDSNVQTEQNDSNAQVNDSTPVANDSVAK